MDCDTRSVGSIPKKFTSAIPSLLVLGILFVPALVHASATFTWVPIDGSPSSGIMTVDAPASGAFSVSQTAVTSFEFTFRPGVTVRLDLPPETTSLPMMSFDGGALDYGDWVLSKFRYPVASLFGFYSQQLGADIAYYDYDVDPRKDALITLRGHWIRADIVPPEKPLYPRGISSVIDIRPITGRRDIGNAPGLAYNAETDLLYLAHGSDPRGAFIYTLDTRGHLLGEVDFQVAYKPGYWIESLVYDESTAHLLVYAQTLGGPYYLVEMSTDGSTIFGEVLIPPGGSSLTVRDDGIWVTSADTLEHYTRAGVFIEEVSVAASFTAAGSGGPGPLTSSFNGQGFFVADHSGQRLLEVDRNGREIAAVTTAMLGDTLLKDGRASAIASDLGGRRIFLQGNNRFIFVLSDAFPKIQNVNSLVQLDEGDLTATFDPTSVPAGPAGTLRIKARFHNVSGFDICSVFFQVVELPGHRLEGVWLGPAKQPLQGFDQMIIGHRPGFFEASSEAEVNFTIDLAVRNFFNFFVNMWGTPQAPGQPCP